MTVAIVTGAASGLGQTFAVALARARYRVAGLDVEEMDETEQLIEAAGNELLPVRCDVRDEESVDAAVAEVVREYGALHVVVNNAGIYPPIPFERTSLDDWHRIMRVNLDGPFLVTKAALPHLRAAGWGQVVNIVSAVVFLGAPELVAYTTSKSGLVGFTRTATAARTTGARGEFERVRNLQYVPRIDGGSAKH
jgi:NAD(P)-dependent dehydrogenase (short-subunit alcohol dehydrogenase family)